MRLGLIGLGRIGAFHARTLTALPVVDSLVVTDAVPSAIAATVDAVGAEPADSPEALLAAGVDGIIIAAATPAHTALIRAGLDAGISLANSLHAPWNIRALRPGKHVLSEKPSAGAAAQARAVRDVVRQTGRTFMEGFHYRYHPVVTRLHELLAVGALGDPRRVETVMEMPAPDDTDLRWQFELAGGALMDLGCYSLHTHRELTRFGGGAPRVVGARARERAGHPGVDEWLTVDLAFPSGATGAASCHMAADVFLMRHRVIGTRGEATIHDRSTRTRTTD